LYKYLEILYLNLAILPVMHEDEPVYHAYKLLIGFFVSSTHMIYACLSKCKTKRQHMYMYIIFKSSIIYFYHWLILTCLNKHHFLNNINCKKNFYTERHSVIILISSKKKEELEAKYIFVVRNLMGDVRWKPQ